MRCVACSHKLHSRKFMVSGGHIDGGLPAIEPKSEISDGKMDKKLQLFQATMTQRQYAVKAMTEQVKQLTDLHNAFMAGMRGFEDKELVEKDMPFIRYGYKNSDKVAKALRVASEALHSFKADYDEFIPHISKTFDMTESEQEKFSPNIAICAVSMYQCVPVLKGTTLRVESHYPSSRRMSYESTFARGALTVTPSTYDST